MASAFALHAFAWCIFFALLPLQEAAGVGRDPFMFQLRSAAGNPVTYQHTTLVNQLIALPCYFKHDGKMFGVSNRTDMAWYRRSVSVHHARTFPSMSNSHGHILILEPVVGYNWFLCDTAHTSKLRHAVRYEKYFSEFKLGRLNLNWDYYQDFSEFNKGQFKHHLFYNELSITEIIIFMNATLRKIDDSPMDISELTKPREMGAFKLSLLKILESECRWNEQHYCENPTVDILIPSFETDGSITIQGKMKLYLSNEKLLKLGSSVFREKRKEAIRLNVVRWTMNSQSIDLGALGTLNPDPLAFGLTVSSQAQTKSDCVGSGSYLSVKYDWECVLCRPGYYLKNEPWIHAASEKNSICQLCPVGTFSSTWGSVECYPCPRTHTTRKVGSTRHSDCLPLSTFEMESRIQELLSYFRVDESDDYKKAAMLAAMFITPWIVFIVCLLVSLAYGHNEVKASESRFQLEKELGAIVLRIRRNYNSLLEKSLQL